MGPLLKFFYDGSFTPAIISWLGFAIIIISLSLYNILGCNDRRDEINTNNKTTAVATTKTNIHEIMTNSDALGYGDALYIAEGYSKYSFMSKQRIYDQLTSKYEGYSSDVAHHAVDNLKADYKVNALKMAKSYINSTGLSGTKLYKQLTDFEKFTDEEASYAIDNL